MNGLTKFFLYCSGCSGVAGVVLTAALSLLLAYFITLNHYGIRSARRENAANILFGGWGDAILTSIVVCFMIAILCLIGAVFACLIG